MSLYLWVILGTISGPLVLSFDKKVAFYKEFKYVFLATICIGIPFIIWDIYFTKNLIWGFTPEYLSGIYISNLPLEECLFFLVVPFACIFIHQVLKAYFTQFKGDLLAKVFGFLCTISALTLAITNLENWYTSSACILAALLTIGIFYIQKCAWYSNFVLTYLVALIPFLLVNGILTGSFTENPIVWYNHAHIIGFRIFTIPIEDLFYNYSMLLPIIGIVEFLKNKK
jgi:lycopene cyclase domain-containing protein